MEFASAFVLGGTKKTVENTLSSVFSTLVSKARTRIQLEKLTERNTEQYANYIHRSVGVFPLFATTKSVSVEDAYIRIAISSKIDREVYRGRSAIASDLIAQSYGANTRPDLEAVTPLEAISGSDGIFALLGAPGSGKTTAFKHLALRAAKGEPVRGTVRVPLFLAVRELEAGRRSIWVEGAGVLRDFGFTEAENIFRELLTNGLAIVLLDGLDETDQAHQANLLRELSDLQERYPKTVFCVSARPHSLASGLAGATKWETLPLDLEQRKALAKRWFDAVSKEKGTRFAADCAGSPAMLDLGSNPLLLSIICALYYNELDIPKERTELYARASEGMLGGWDNFRNIARESTLKGLSITKRLQLTCHIAAELFDKGDIVFAADDLERYGTLDRVADVLRAEVPSAQDVTRSLSNDFGILAERSPRVYSFAHLTMHEYFVAKYVVDYRREANLLSEHLHDPAWAEVIVLTAKLLPDASEFIRTLFQGLRVERGTGLSIAARALLAHPNCSSAIRNEIMHEFCRKVIRATRVVPAEFSRKGDSVIAEFNVEQDFVRLLGAARDVEEEDRTSKVEAWSRKQKAERGSALQNSGRPIAPRSKHATSVRSPREFTIFGRLNEINTILTSMDFVPDEHGFQNSSLLCALGGERAQRGITLRITVRGRPYPIGTSK